MILFILFLVSPAFSQVPQGYIGRAGAVLGEVLVDGEEIKTGHFLKSGQTVETREGKVTLLLGNETVMHLDRKSRLVLSEYLIQKNKEGAMLDLQYGAAKNLVRNIGKTNKTFFIRTKSAVMGVRGTETVVKSQSKSESQFIVVEGAAEVVPSALRVTSIREAQKLFDEAAPELAQAGSLSAGMENAMSRGNTIKLTAGMSTTVSAPSSQDRSSGGGASGPNAGGGGSGSASSQSSGSSQSGGGNAVKTETIGVAAAREASNEIAPPAPLASTSNELQKQNSSNPLERRSNPFQDNFNFVPNGPLIDPLANKPTADVKFDLGSLVQ